MMPRIVGYRVTVTGDMVTIEAEDTSRRTDMSTDDARLLCTALAEALAVNDAPGDGESQLHIDNANLKRRIGFLWKMLARARDASFGANEILRRALLSDDADATNLSHEP